MARLKSILVSLINEKKDLLVEEQKKRSTEHMRLVDELTKLPTDFNIVKTLNVGLQGNAKFEQEMVEQISGLLSKTESALQKQETLITTFASLKKDVQFDFAKVDEGKI